MAKQKFWNGSAWEVVGTDASKVAVLDAQNKLTATNVEDALLELFTFANDGKSKWASVIGSPILMSDTFAQMQTKTQTVKNTIAANLTAKGQTASGSETLTALANKLASVSTGKQYAEGTFKPISGNTVLNQTGLSFTPTYVFGYLITSNSSNRSALFVGSNLADIADFNSLQGLPTSKSSLMAYNQNGTYSEEFYYRIAIVSNGFNVDLARYEGMTIKWVAIG